MVGNVTCDACGTNFHSEYDKFFIVEAKDTGAQLGSVCPTEDCYDDFVYDADSSVDFSNTKTVERVIQ